MTFTSRQTATVPLIRESDRGTGTFEAHFRQLSGQPPIFINDLHSVLSDANSFNPTKTFAAPHIPHNQPNHGDFNFSTPKGQNSSDAAPPDLCTVYTSKQHPAHIVSAPLFTHVNTQPTLPSPPGVYTSKHTVTATNPGNVFTRVNTQLAMHYPHSVYTSKHTTKPAARSTAPSSTQANTTHSKLDDGVYSCKHPAVEPSTGAVFTRVNSTPHTPGSTTVYTRKHTASGLANAATPCAHQSPTTNPPITDRMRNSGLTRFAKATAFTRVNTSHKPIVTQPGRTSTRITGAPSLRDPEINVRDALFTRVNAGTQRFLRLGVYACKQETCENLGLGLFTPDPSGVFTRVNASAHALVADRVYTRKQGWQASADDAASKECTAFAAVIRLMPAIPALQRSAPGAAREMQCPDAGERLKRSVHQNRIDQAAMLHERLAMS